MSHFLDLTYEELAKEIPGKEKYRLRQICGWIFHKRKFSFEEMLNLPLPFRQSLSEKFKLKPLAVVKEETSSQDQTTKFTFRTEDQKTMTAVYLPHLGYRSLCLSTQVGCAWACAFCASGLVPLERNLSSGEILAQIFLIEERTKQKLQNVLFMGMGEPLANYSNVVKALRWMVSPNGLQMHPSRITLSTTGLAPQISKLAQEKLKINLALSLHAPNDYLRKKIMPMSSKFKILDVLHACKYYQTLNKSDFTIEYILLNNVNDDLDSARELVELLDSIRFPEAVKINLIPYNPVPSLRFKTPSEKSMQSFFQTLKNAHFTVHTRKPQGKDIGAACGQLS